MLTDSAMMNKKNILALAVTMVLLCAGCTREDYRNCPSGQYICFEAMNPKHDYKELVQTVDLLFYDRQGSLAAQYNYTRSELRDGDRAAFVPIMEPGEYTVVAMINHADCYSTTQKENYSTLNTQLVDQVLETAPEDFFTAIRNIDITGNYVDMKDQTMTLAKQNNHINLTVRLKDYALPAGGSIDSYITACNGQFHYSTYSCPGHSHRTYRPEVLPVNDLAHGFRITTMRLWRGMDISLVVDEYRGGTRAAAARSVTLDLVEELAKVKDDAGNFLYDTDDKLEYNDQYDIELTLGPDFVVVGLTINNWAIIDDGVEV